MEMNEASGHVTICISSSENRFFKKYLLIMSVSNILSHKSLDQVLKVCPRLCRCPLLAMKYRFVVTEVPVEMGKLSLVYYIVGRRSSTTLAEDGPRMVRMTLQNYDFISRPTSTEFDAFLQLHL